MKLYFKILYTLKIAYCIELLTFNFDIDSIKEKLTENVQSKSKKQNNFYNKDMRNLQQFENKVKYIHLSSKSLCSEIGHIAKFKEISFNCMNRNVTKSEYGNLVLFPENNCKMMSKFLDLCVCPKNYEGYYCQRPIPNLCDFNKIILNDINLINSKNNFNEEYLDQNRLSLLESNIKFLNFTLKAKCALMKSKSLNRFSNNTLFFSYYNTKKEIYLLDINDHLGFNYSVENPHLVFLKDPLIEIQISIFDSRMSNKIVYSNKFDKKQSLSIVKGESDFDLNIEINELMKNQFINSGSLFFQIKMINQNDEELKSMIFSSQIELSNNFNIKNGKFSKALTVGIVFIIICVLCLLIYLICSYRRKLKIN